MIVDKFIPRTLNLKLFTSSSFLSPLGGDGGDSLLVYHTQ